MDASPPAGTPAIGVSGCGLIGASVAWGARLAGLDVVVHDTDADAVRLTCSLTGARPWPAAGTTGAPCSPGDAGSAPRAPDVVFVAVPPRQTGPELARLTRLLPDATVTDTCSVKSRPLADAQSLGADMSRIVGGHPMAGRERGGAASARATLFAGRTWVLCPQAAAPARVAQLSRLVVLLGAQPVYRTAAEHDSQVALLSHVPQLLSSALAASVRDCPDEHLELTGPGMTDMTRLAGSPSGLWAQIISDNAPEVSRALNRVLGELERLRAGLGLAAADPTSTAQGVSEAVRSLLEDGGRGRILLPVKGDRLERALAWVAVPLPDVPGSLARMLTTVGGAGVNVEDVRIEHTAAAPTGTALLAVSPDDGSKIVEVLTAAGMSVWSVP